jgi:hypothetical protein
MMSDMARESAWAYLKLLHIVEAATRVGDSNEGGAVDVTAGVRNELADTTCELVSYE